MEDPPKELDSGQVQPANDEVSMSNHKFENEDELVYFSGAEIQRQTFRSTNASRDLSYIPGSN